MSDLGVSTTIHTKDGITQVVYHQTAVVSFNHELIELDSGGWRTQTTKKRMNQASEMFGLGFQVYQVEGDWFVTYKTETLAFIDGLELKR